MKRVNDHKYCETDTFVLVDNTKLGMEFNCDVGSMIIPGHHGCKKHVKDNKTIVTFDCVDCNFYDYGGYITGNSCLLLMDEYYCNLFDEWGVNTPLSILGLLRDKTLYIRLLEHQLHLVWRRYRSGHYWCSNDVEYTGLDINPVYTTAKVKIYTSQSGYKIFVSQDAKLLEVDQWVKDHPIVINHVLPTVDVVGVQCKDDILNGIKNDMNKLSDPIVLQQLAYLYSLGNVQVIPYLRQSLYILHNYRPTCKGIIIEGDPGLGKSYDLTRSLKDVYWLPYDHKTKNYFDGYVGQENIVIDDIGHYSEDEWKIVIRLINDVPWHLPMARVDRKDLISNVSGNLFLTTNNMKSLMSMARETRDAICRRCECYRYSGDKVYYRRYSMASGRYEDVYWMTREVFREIIQSKSAPTVLSSTQYLSNIFSLGLEVVSYAFRCAGLPSFQRLGYEIGRMCPIYLPYSLHKLDVMTTSILNVSYDVFDWAQLSTNRKRFIRYLSHMLDRPLNDVDYGPVRNMNDFLKAEVRICGKDINMDLDYIYDRVPVKVVERQPGYTVPERNLDGISADLVEMFDIDESFCVPERTVQPKEIIHETYKLVKKPGLHRYYDIFEDVYYPIAYNVNLQSPRLKPEFVSDYVEDYRPNHPYRDKVRYDKLNCFLNKSSSNRTKKRREQRKRARQ